ncbi:class II fumarate hydratase [Pleionea mediterranea]|uniref:Fumarase class II n=1 Tax=Pleionea mediterranea TaxID=523701 RepID=A0A316FWY4_9GAMM|nr:class II fumarate hydratase [Pleionea mediterranea]PWK53211.1 fumarase class II [Pleionea mediterranea]
MTDYRKESDSLGEVKVPVDALYGAQTQRAIDNFDYSQKNQMFRQNRPLPVPFIVCLAQVKKAAARANANLDCISHEQSQAIIAACDAIISGKHMDQFPVSVFQTGSGTSSNMNMNEVIASLAKQRIEQSSNSDKNKATVHPNDHVNYGQSSNDVIPTTVQLALLVTVVERVFPAIDNLLNQLSELSKKHHSVIKTGRTHLMDAMPLSLADEFLTWRHQISESRERLVSSLSRLAEIPLGGTAIGTGINRHKDFADKAAEHLAEQLALPIKPCANLASRISAQDPALEVHGQLKVLATVLMKIANDLRWMNSGPNVGLAEIQLKALQPGSSIMPGKVNPVIPESVAMMMAEVMGNDTSLTIANQSGNFQLNVMLPLIADKSIASSELIADALNALADKALVDITVNNNRLQAQLSKNPILATALNTRIGYEKAAEIAKTAQKENRSVIDVAEEKTDISRKELESILDPEKQARPFE